MNFIPSTPTKSASVPFYDDVTSNSGWQGQTTTKTIHTLQSEIVSSISRLGGMVSSFQRGTFEIDGLQREGFRLHYLIEAADGTTIPGRIDIAALPVRKTYGRSGSAEKRKEKSLRMCLYMLRTALDGTWFLQQLSPGYAPLMPWMLVSGDKTITQLWQESSVMSNLLPPGETDFVVEGSYNEDSRL